jgi:phosphoribosylformylglycinamidine synthase subunit PurL
VAFVPQRETKMTPYEIMLSESQERMLLVVKKGREAEVERIFDKWDLHAVRIGEVTTDGLMRVKNSGEIVAEIPTRSLTDDAPVYRRPMTEPAYLTEARQLDLAGLGSPLSARDAFMRLLGSPEIASKRWVYRQYDHMVRTNTLVMPGMGAGVVRVKGTRRALAMSVDGNGRFVYLDPHLGAQLAVAEAARNVACAGGLPIGATNCLNFANPQRPEIMWQFARAVEGIGVACRALDIPITGGNVSLYNETDGRGVLPTPVIGVVGLIEDADTVVRRAFRSAGDAVVLLGESYDELGGSEYLKVAHGLIQGAPPILHLLSEAALQRVLVKGAAQRIIRSAHDCAEGGLAITVAECCFDVALGVEIDVPGVHATSPAYQDVATLFGESASRVVVSVAPDRLGDLLAMAASEGVSAAQIGIVGGDRIRMSVDDRGLLRAPQSYCIASYTRTLPKWTSSAKSVASLGSSDIPRHRTSPIWACTPCSTAGRKAPASRRQTGPASA